MTAEAEEFRCRRGVRCTGAPSERDPILSEQGERTGRRGGAVLTVRDGLCDSCVRYVGYALGSLPWDVAELTTIIGKGQHQRFRAPDMPPSPHVMLHPPILIREDVEALRALIDHETGVWADSVARATGMDVSGDWSALTAARSRQGDRVEKACTLLRYRLSTLLGLPVTEHRARSLTARRGDGHDPDSTTFTGDDYWCNRDGITGASLLLDLHRRTEAIAGRAPADRLLTPCFHCRRPALVREHRNKKVVCRACHAETSDDDYDTLLDCALVAHTGIGRCR